jgi:hypothetical protein
MKRTKASRPAEDYLKGWLGGALTTCCGMAEAEAALLSREQVQRVVAVWTRLIQRRRRPGWDSWGNEIESTIRLP